METAAHHHFTFVAAPLLSNCFANEAAPESAYIESLAYGHTQNLCYFYPSGVFLNPGGKYSQESLLDAYQNDKRFKKVFKHGLDIW